MGKTAYTTSPSSHIMFIDMANSDKLCKKLGLKAYHALLLRYYSVVITATEKWKGEVISIVGDGLVINYTNQIGDDLVRLFIELYTTLEKQLGITIKAGIHYGYYERGQIHIKKKVYMAPVIVGHIVEAFRLEQLCKKYNTPLLISYQSYVKMKTRSIINIFTRVRATNKVKSTTFRSIYRLNTLLLTDPPTNEVL